jgi:hypothetical protein
MYILSFTKCRTFSVALCSQSGYLFEEYYFVHKLINKYNSYKNLDKLSDLLFQTEKEHCFSRLQFFLHLLIVSEYSPNISQNENQWIFKA